MISFPPSKINLGLNIIRKRNDGYHDLETCFYPVPWTDVLEIIPSQNFSFDISGSVIPGSAEDNLCVKAYHLLKKDFNLGGVRIHLHKVIPTGAGLGGGSSDGAHTLRLLNIIFNINLSDEVLMRYAATLGSDCSFFVQDLPMFGRGRGELLSPAPLSLTGKYLVLLKPDIHVSTANAYGGIRPRVQQESIRETLTRPVQDWRAHLNNDFEETVFAAHKRLGEIKNMLYARGAHYAAMSGSGSTLYGIFDFEPRINDITSDITVWSGWMKES